MAIAHVAEAAQVLSSRTWQQNAALQCFVEDSKNCNSMMHVQCLLAEPVNAGFGHASARLVYKTNCIQTLSTRMCL
jgi:hypothetical protein